MPVAVVDGQRQRRGVERQVTGPVVLDREGPCFPKHVEHGGAASRREYGPRRVGEGGLTVEQSCAGLAECGLEQIRPDSVGVGRHRHQR